VEVVDTDAVQVLNLSTTYIQSTRHIQSTFLVPRLGIHAGVVALFQDSLVLEAGGIAAHAYGSLFAPYREILERFYLNTIIAPNYVLGHLSRQVQI
jgi:hypothetical protein